MNLKITFSAIPFILCLTISIFIQILFGSTNSYINFLIFISYLITLFFIDKRFILKYSYIIFYISTNILGVFFIETSLFYLNELRIYSKDYNSLLLIILVHIIFIEAIRHTDKKRIFESLSETKKSLVEITKNYSINKLKIVEFLLFVITLITIYLFIQVIDKPFFIVGMDRFLYEQNFMSSFGVKFSNSLLYCTPLFAIYIYHTKNKCGLFALFLLSLYYFWIGHKFSFFLVMAYIVFLPFIVNGSKKLLNKILKLGFLLFITLMLVVSIQSYTVYNRDFEDNTQYLKMRIAQQGQLWWATYGLKNSINPKLSELSDETRNFFKLKINREDLYNSGIYKIMKLTTPIEVFNQKVFQKNSRYAYSTQASIYYYFGFLGLILFSVISGIIYALVINGLMKSILNIQLISAVLLARLLTIINRTIMQSDFQDIFSIEVVVIVIVLVIVHIIRRVIRSTTNPNKIIGGVA